MVRMHRSSQQPLLPTTTMSTPLSPLAATLSPLGKTAKKIMNIHQHLNNLHSHNSHSHHHQFSPNPHKRRRSSSPVYECFRRQSTRRTIDQLIQMTPLFQVILLVIILCLVVHSHIRATNAADQLLQFKEEESLLLLQLQKIERHSLQLHENISKRLKRAGIIISSTTAITDNNNDEVPSSITATDSSPLASASSSVASPASIGKDPLEDQTSELYSMVTQLKEQTATIQARLQDAATDHIIREYGEGPVKVIMEIEFPDEYQSEQVSNNYYYYSPFSTSSKRRNTYDSSNHISIILWPDTPYASWTWLEQISRHVWDGAVLDWDWNQPVLVVTPSKPDPLKRGNLDFVETEHNANNHGVWTVGLRDDEHGSLQMFLNLQDNGEYHQHEACVGKILDGFEALQRLVEASRGNKDISSSIRVKRVSAVHVTKKELGIL